MWAFIQVQAICKRGHFSSMYSNSFKLNLINKQKNVRKQGNIMCCTNSVTPFLFSSSTVSFYLNAYKLSVVVYYKCVMNVLLLLSLVVCYAYHKRNSHFCYNWPWILNCIGYWLVIDKLQRWDDDGVAKSRVSVCFVCYITIVVVVVFVGVRTEVSAFRSDAYNKVTLQRIDAHFRFQ